jgi:hypothetical protein
MIFLLNINKTYRSAPSAVYGKTTMKWPFSLPYVSVVLDFALHVYGLVLRNIKIFFLPFITNFVKTAKLFFHSRLTYVCYPGFSTHSCHAFDGSTNL